MNTYDVFISKNTKDLDIAKRIEEVLESHGLRVFESSKELKNFGGADYAQIIDNALENSNNLIVICSDQELGSGVNGDSSWVYYEWSSFRNELLSKRKNGNIVVILSGDANISSIAYGLRKFEAIPVEDIDEDWFINYFTQEKDEVKTSCSKNDQKEDDNRTLYLRAFDFGFHLSNNIYAQSINEENLYDLKEDWSCFSAIPLKYITTDKPDPMEILQKMTDFYGDKIAKYFSFGQNTGLLSIINLFIKKGLEMPAQQKDVFTKPFLKEGRELAISEEILTNAINMVSNNTCNDARVVNYHKIIRHAILTMSSKKCPFCGYEISSDCKECPNCYTPINE